MITQYTAGLIPTNANLFQPGAQIAIYAIGSDGIPVPAPPVTGSNEYLYFCRHKGRR